MSASASIDRRAAAASSCWLRAGTDRSMMYRGIGLLPSCAGGPAHVRGLLGTPAADRERGLEMGARGLRAPQRLRDLAEGVQAVRFEPPLAGLAIRRQRLLERRPGL